MARLFANASSEFLAIAGSIVSACPFAMGCWFYSNNTTTKYMLMCAWESGGRIWSLDIDGGHISKPVRAAQWTGFVSTSTSYSANTWHYALAIFAANDDRRILLDNAGKGTSSSNQSVPSPTSFIIGLHPAYGQYMDGEIAEAAIWDLSDWPGATASDKADEFERVASPSLANHYSPEFFKLGLIGYWRLVRDEDQDRVGGYDLTAYNTPSIADHPPMIYPAPQFIMPPPLVVPTRRVFITHT